MGIEEETDRTLFIRNIDARVTEELLFELFLQAGPLLKTAIPKDPEGRQKSFGFAVYKHEVSVPYAMRLLDGTPLFGRSLHVQFRSGSSHSSAALRSPAKGGQRSPVQFHSPPYTPPPQSQRSHLSPDGLQKHAAAHFHQQLPLSSSGFALQPPAGGKSPRVGSRQHHNSPYQHPPPPGGRTQRYAEEQQASGRYQQPKDRTPGRHHDNRGGRSPYDWSNSRSHQDNRWRRY